MQSRVFTVVGSITSAMSPIGMALAGPMADLFGVRTWFLVGGVVCALMGVVSFFIPVIMHIEDNGGRLGSAERNKLVAATEPVRAATE